jgi:hypothetical protein
MKPGGKAGAKYTFASRYYKKPRKKSPGPGRYKPRFVQTEKVRPSYSLRMKTPKKHKRKAPGPGEYHRNRKSTVSGVPSYKIGSG